MAKDLSYSVLLDYYGAMLTEKQFEALDFYYNQDLSLAEISEIMGVSRQGVMDIIRRGEAQLDNMENRLSLTGHYSKLSAASLRLEKIIEETYDNSLKQRLLEILKDIR